MIITASNKERLLFLLKMFMDNTDENHDYTIKDLISLYEKNNTPATVKTIRNDIQTLIEAGFSIVETSSTGKPTYYSYDQPFNGADLKLITDAVSAAKFISPENSRELMSKLKTLANKHTREELLADADVSGHLRSPNRNLFASIQIISAAIARGKKISYQYYDYDLNKRRILHNNGEVYSYSPYGFTWNEDRYYILGRADKRPDSISPFRVDLLSHVRMLDEDAIPAPDDFDSKKYSDKVFKMFGGEETELTLEADNTLIRKFVDRFGMDFDITKTTDKSFSARVRVSISPTFFSWLFQYNGKIRILGPAKVRRQYADMLARTLSDYKEGS